MARNDEDAVLDGPVGFPTGPFSFRHGWNGTGCGTGYGKHAAFSTAAHVTHSRRIH
jgi:hypothetical protein